MLEKFKERAKDSAGKAAKAALSFATYSVPGVGDCMTAFDVNNYQESKRKSVAAVLMGSRLLYVSACGILGGPLAAIAANEVTALSENLAAKYNMKASKVPK
jgi:hypothetical protein